MFTVHVLKSSEGKIYTGHTDNLPRRLSEHNSGLCKTTKSGTDWQTIYTEQFPTRGEAMKREK